MSKEVEVDLKVLRKAAFEILDAYDDLSAVGSKQLRRECEQRLGLKSKVLDTAENKEIINDLIGQYSAVYVARNRSGNANTDNDDYKKKKFSDAEKKLIMEVTKEFMLINVVDISEICTCLRDIEDRSRKTYSLWKELGSLLPNRSVAQIRQHVQRALMREHAGDKVWTEEDKKTLSKLHGLYGANWNKIGRMMGFLDDDCKHMFHRLQGRSKTGKFTDEEDRQLVSTVRSVLGLGPAVSPADFPRKGIPWIVVAERLDNARLPLDYLRHWPYAVRKCLVNDASSSSSSSSAGGKKGAAKKSGSSALTVASGAGTGNSAVMDKFTLRASKNSVQNMSDEERTRIVKWLKRLQEEDATDESEVCWAEIDTELLLPYSFSTKAWRMMTKTFDADMSFEDKLEKLLRIYEDRNVNEIQRKPRKRNKDGSHGSDSDSDADSDDGQRKKKKLTGYMHFCNEQRPLIKAEHPSLAQPQVMVMLGERWKALSAEQKEECNRAAAAIVAADAAAAEGNVRSGSSGSSSSARASAEEAATSLITMAFLPDSSSSRPHKKRPIQFDSDSDKASSSAGHNKSSAPPQRPPPAGNAVPSKRPVATTSAPAKAQSSSSAGSGVEEKKAKKGKEQQKHASDDEEDDEGDDDEEEEDEQEEEEEEEAEADVPKVKTESGHGKAHQHQHQHHHKQDQQVKHENRGHQKRGREEEDEDDDEDNGDDSDDGSNDDHQENQNQAKKIKKEGSSREGGGAEKKVLTAEEKAAKRLRKLARRAKREEKKRRKEEKEKKRGKEK